MRFAFVFVATMLVITAAAAHHWYPPECCGGGDCQEITEFNVIGNNWHIKTKDQSVIVSSTFPIRASQDTKKHICIFNNKVYCLFFPAEG